MQCIRLEIFESSFSMSQGIYIHKDGCTIHPRFGPLSLRSDLGFVGSLRRKDSDAPSLRYRWELCSILCVLLNNPITKHFPLLLVDVFRLLYFDLCKTTVLDAPLGKLFPAMNSHTGIANHDLVEFVGQ
jgi:hypothetical protein